MKRKFSSTVGPAHGRVPERLPPAGTVHRNVEPVLPGFYSDPTVCWTGDRFCLATSSFEYFPAAPIFESADLQEWTQVGNVIDRVSQVDFSGTRDGSGIFGSTLRFHGGRLWFVTTDMARFDEGQKIFTAETAAGPWSEPVFIRGAIGIDPDLVSTLGE